MGELPVCRGTGDVQGSLPLPLVTAETGAGTLQQPGSEAWHEPGRSLKPPATSHANALPLTLNKALLPKH